MSRFFAPKATPETPKEPEKPATPPPATITKEEVQTLVTGAVQGVAAELGRVVGELSTQVQALASRQPQVVVQPAGVPPTSTRISDEEIDTAVMSGQGAAARIRALVDRAVTEATDRVIKERIDPLQNWGVNSIANLSQEVAASKMPHYPKYKKEIDARLATLDPSVRANPAVLKMVHDAVVGENIEDFRREAAEAATRQAQETQSTGTPTAGRSAAPGTGAGREPTREAPEVPSVETLGGAEGVAALGHKGKGGQSQDDFARGLGYKDWNTYMKQYDELLKQESAA